MNYNKILKEIDTIRTQCGHLEATLRYASILLKDNLVWDALTNSVPKYTDPLFNKLPLKSKCLTALSLDMQPSIAYDQFLTRIQRLSVELANDIYHYGIKYYIDGRGTCITNSISFNWYDNLKSDTLLTIMSSNPSLYNSIQSEVRLLSKDLTRDLELYLHERNATISDFDLLVS